MDEQAEPLMGLAALMRMVFAGSDIVPLSRRLVERATSDAEDANALMDLSILLHLRFEQELALAVQAQALAVRRHYRLPAKGRAGIRLLALAGAGDLMTNAPLEFLVEESDVSLDILYLSPGGPLPPELPEHDIAFVAVGESDQNRLLLAQLEEVVPHWPRPVLNLPERIARTSRDGGCALLRDAPGIAMPVSARITRRCLEQIADGKLSLSDALEGGEFPIILRPIDSHAGRGLEKIDRPAAIAGYLEAMPEGEFHIARFVDYRSRDGLYRKYRVVLIEGRPYAGHMAVSEHWMIHYLNANMLESAENRAEEARFMARFDQDFALRHRAALRAVGQRIGLDYLVIDCAETADGALLIFEIDSGAVIHAMDPVEVFPYKQPQMRKIFGAFRAMLGNRAAGPLRYTA
jgi:glutathione synthase/RimK-type ligase-like ATP-grasp enzyme